MIMNPMINAFVIFRDVALELYDKMNKRNPFSTSNELIAFIVIGSLAC